MPRSLVEKHDEVALTIALVSNRPLFGEVYSRLQSDYFRQMPPGSGVLVRPTVPTCEIIPGAVRPGDIDLLIIPYEGDELILDRVMAIEVKAIRARFEKQDRSPNDFGFSQARALLDLGFPHVAVAHLIVSDESPREEWKEVRTFRVLDSEGSVGEPTSSVLDLMPVNLIHRSFGRLERNCLRAELGLVSAYVTNAEYHHGDAGHTVWQPRGRPTGINPVVSHSTMEAVAGYYYRNAASFLDNPRFDPD